MAGESPEFVIDAVFSLADELKSPIPDIEDVVNSVSKSLSQAVPTHPKSGLSKEKIDTLLGCSPLPIKKCKVRMENFIESEVHNKITEACNNAIFKQEPGVENENLKTETNESNSENTDGRPSRKRKPNPMLLSDEFCLNKKDFDELSKRHKMKKPKSVTCQIDHDIIMSVAEKCLPDVLHKSELREDIKMVSILPPTIDVNINSTQVVINWKEKVSHPVFQETTRPQTARTRKKLRTQEQIDKEKEALKKIKQRAKPKCKQKWKSPDTSPPHLEPYGGQLPNIQIQLSTPKSPDHMPPSLQPYDVNSDAKSSKAALGEQSISIIEKHNTDNNMGQSLLCEQRIPLSLTGRLRKPNQQYEEYLTKFEKPQAKSAAGKKVGASDQNTTINHEKKSLQVMTKLGNASQPSSKRSESLLLPQSMNVGTPSSQLKTVVSNVGSQMVISSSSALGKTCVTSTVHNNKKLTSAIGELAKIENTKKFFQLVVGDKVVLIPTNGDNVVPKAFVMDIAATRPGSQIAARPQSQHNFRPRTPQVSSPLFRPQSSILASSPTSSTISQPSSVVSSGGVKQILVMSPPSGSTQEPIRVKQEPIPPKTSTELSSLIPQIPKTAIALSSQSIQKTQSSPAPLQNIIIRSSGNKQQSIIVQKKTATPTPQPTRFQIIQTPNSIQNLPVLTDALKGATSGTPSLLKNVFVNTTSAGGIPQKIVYPLMQGGHIVSTTSAPYPTYIMTNTSNTTSVVPSSVQPATKNTETVNTTTKVKDEPDNIEEYEKAAKSFKGVPDDGSETESDEETRSAQADRQSKKCKEHVPEVAIHVPASESETSERIRKLKERMKQQQLQVETMRKSLQASKTAQ